MNNFEIYQSPISWRCGSDQVRIIWSEVNKRLIWRRLWIALSEFRIVTFEQLADRQALSELKDASGYIGFASQRASQVTRQIKEQI